MISIMLWESKIKRVIIIGAAGFIGSNLTKIYINAGYHVIAIDGIMKNTGGNRNNLIYLKNNIKMVH